MLVLEHAYKYAQYSHSYAYPPNVGHCFVMLLNAITCSFNCYVQSKAHTPRTKKNLPWVGFEPTTLCILDKCSSYQGSMYMYMYMCNACQSSSLLTRANKLETVLFRDHHAYSGPTMSFTCELLQCMGMGIFSGFFYPGPALNCQLVGF